MTPSSMDKSIAIQQAAAVIRDCEAILIGAGAGMGVDSGLPDFRGEQGFWKAYPAFHGLQFAEVSNPVWFRRDADQAWGFFGHRLHLYRDTIPHPGFSILRRWCETKANDYFVFTSNVDGQFQKAGFDASRILECHGSIHHLQCASTCNAGIWDADDVSLQVDPNTIRATSPLPECTACSSIARPNILMFGDGDWHPGRFEDQEIRYRRWLHEIQDKKLAVIELGAGHAVPTVRYQCESRGGKLIRINPRDFEAPASSIAIAQGALTALEQIDALVDF